MQPDIKSEVVYRRKRAPALSTDESATADLAKRAFVRTITPLVVGFLLLLGLISVLGWRSANQMQTVGENASKLSDQYSLRLGLLSDLRLKAAQLDSETRVRHTAVSQRGLAPPFSVAVNEARD